MRHHVTLVVDAGGPQEVSLGEISQEDWDALHVAADKGGDVVVTTRTFRERERVMQPPRPYASHVDRLQPVEHDVIEGNIWLRGSAIVAILSTDGGED